VKVLNHITQHLWLKLSLIFIGAVLLTVIIRAGTTSSIDSYAACIEAGYPVLQTDPPICRDGLHNFTGTPLPIPTASGSSTAVPFELLVDGDTHASIPTHRQDFINSLAQWQAYWREVHAGLATLPPLIPVDFTQSSVVAVSLGQQSTTGFGLKITNITSSEAGTTVDLTESTPTITCSVAQTITNRYVIVRTPKLIGPVSFRITSEKRHCQ
jgi:hypothetical protein